MGSETRMVVGNVLKSLSDERSDLQGARVDILSSRSAVPSVDPAKCTDLFFFVEGELTSQVFFWQEYTGIVPYECAQQHTVIQ